MGGLSYFREECEGVSSDARQLAVGGCLPHLLQSAQMGREGSHRPAAEIDRAGTDRPETDRPYPASLLLRSELLPSGHHDTLPVDLLPGLHSDQSLLDGSNSRFHLYFIFG